jgi:6-pyruvoyltetrahydropterin/6-carboxytetrahydropterin synthase
MLVLTRTVRCALNPPELGGTANDGGTNGYAGSPPVRGLGRYYQFEVSCFGDVDPLTGYLTNIKDIDAGVRLHVLPLVVRECAQRPGTDVASLLPELLLALNREPPLAGRVRSLRWWLSPYYSLEVLSVATVSSLLSQKFDLSASHRLHSAALSADENRRLYGKCNNPSGHGHNYQFEPCVAVRVDGPAFSLDTLEQLAESTIVQRFDHKNLNTDTTEFAPGRGLNPSVENIARVFFDLLKEPVRSAGGELRSLTVWETDRTSSTYPG